MLCKTTMIRKSFLSDGNNYALLKALIFSNFSNDKGLYLKLVRDLDQ